jgi:RND family efflux transporter MFP subunit
MQPKNLYIDIIMKVPLVEKNRKLLLTFLAPLALSALLSACGKAPEAQPQPAPKSWDLAVVKVATAGLPIDYTTVGSVVSDQRIEVTSRMSGYIHELLVREGDRVRRGQIIARLDGADVEGAIRQSRAGVGAASSALADAQIDFERFQRLYERASISENEWRKVRLKRDAARESLNQAQAAQDTANAQRAYVDIRSPDDGVVVARLKQAGDLAAPGAPMLTLEVGRALLFETSVSEAHVAAIAVGSRARVKIDALTQIFEGTVSRVVPSGDPVTRSYLVKVALPETAGLMPGMFGRASFAVGDSSSLLVPAQALVERGGLRGVFLVDEAGLARFRWLRTGREWPDRIEVTAGLAAGERIVAAVDPGLREGDRIGGGEVRP